MAPPPSAERVRAADLAGGRQPVYMEHALKRFLGAQNAEKHFAHFHVNLRKSWENSVGGTFNCRREKNKDAPGDVSVMPAPSRIVKTAENDTEGFLFGEML